jgi:hypothetical protein
MAGLLIPILKKRTYVFTGLAAGTSQRIAVAERIDVSQYIDCMVAVRTHVSALDAGVTLDVYGDGHTEDDPGLSFLTSTPLFVAQSLTIEKFTLAYGGTVRGQYISLFLNVNKATSGFSMLTISADIVLRSPDDMLTRTVHI